MNKRLNTRATERVRKTVYLPPETADALRRIGGGNVSEGVRLLVAAHEEKAAA